MRWCSSADFLILPMVDQRLSRLLTLLVAGWYSQIVDRFRLVDRDDMSIDSVSRIPVLWNSLPAWNLSQSSSLVKSMTTFRPGQSVPGNTPEEEPGAESGLMVDQVALDNAAFGRHRRLLFTVAYDLLGSVSDAEDIVQDAWLRWSSAERSDVRDARAYLVRVVTIQSLNRLRTNRARRETYVGPWLPEPLVEPDLAEEVADRAAREHDVSMAIGQGDLVMAAMAIDDSSRASARVALAEGPASAQDEHDGEFGDGRFDEPAAAGQVALAWNPRRRVRR
jgi:DNA-directed RNA polymerase specialized sigma24 family protein